MLNNVIVSSLILVFSSFSYAGSTDMVKIYARTNGAVKKHCKRKYKNKTMEKACYEAWETHVKKECGRQAYKKCLFDEKKMEYKLEGRGKWMKIKTVIDKKMR